MWYLIGFLFLVALLIIAIKRSPTPMSYYDDDENEVVTTTTTTTEENPQPNIAGNLKRQFENDQAYVIDPVDQKKIWLNSNDDMYEDANGKIWRLY